MNRQILHRRDSRASDDRGFTLIEMIAAMALLAILGTLAATPLRNYWFTQALYGGRDELASQVRSTQEQVVSESHPLVFGVRLQEGSSNWGLVRYNPANGSCIETPYEFGSSVSPSVVDFGSPTTETTACMTSLVVAPGLSGAGTPVPGRDTSEYVWFFARGTSTGGTATLTQPSLTDEVTIAITPLTGRVEVGT